MLKFTESLQMRSVRRFCANAARVRPFEEIPGPPTYNYIGSVFAMSQTQKEHNIRQDQFHKVLKQYYKEYGPIFKMGIPGLAEGKKGEFVCVADANEFRKVLQNEPAHPYGGVMVQWPFKEMMKRHGWKTGGLMERGEEWKRIRTELQKGLIGPKDARRYTPHVVKSSQLAAEAFDQYEDDISTFCTRASFDLICSILLGQFMETTDMNTPHNEEHIAFQNEVIKQNEHLSLLLTDPKQQIIRKMGFDTKYLKSLIEHGQKGREMSEKFFAELLSRAESGNLTDAEEASYAVQNYLRTDSKVTREEMSEILSILLSAGVDTTSSAVLWNILQMAMNPDKQEKLHEELMEALGPNGSIQEKTQLKSSLPYLTGVIRESYRLTPALLGGVMRDCPVDVEISGYHIPAGKVMIFINGFRDGDESFLDNSKEYRPERWLPENVEERKGTKSEVLDHQMHSGPFSAGARMCPGARVANMEMYVLLSEIFKKWKVTLDPPDQKWNDIQKLTIVPDPCPKLKVVKRDLREMKSV